MSNLNCIGCDALPALDEEIESALGRQKDIPLPLSARDKSSFAYKTIKDRLPDIVLKTINFIQSNQANLLQFCPRTQSFSELEIKESLADAQHVINELQELLQELKNNSPAKLLTKLTLSSDLEYHNADVQCWNQTLEANRDEDRELPRYFNTSWLLGECYVYRRIKQTLLQTKHLQLLDPFVEQKRAACKSSLSQMVIVSNHLQEVEQQILNSSADAAAHSNEKEEFRLFMQLALWANKSDLSLSGMSAANVQSNELLTNIRESLKTLQENILCDHLERVWARFQDVRNQAMLADKSKMIFVDLVADNSGYEIFVDLCLLHYLTLVLCPNQSGTGNVRFRLHLKCMPWFVSDTMRVDVQWLLSYMCEQNPVLASMATKWQTLLNENLWQLHDHHFWTLPHDFAEMPRVASDLYTTLSGSSLIIFKGDLNYRKLTGDRSWHILTPFDVALRGFKPAPLVALRTCKADTVVGIEDRRVYTKIVNQDVPENWMVSGEYGLIQYFQPK